MFYMNRFFLVAVVSIFFCGCNTSNKGCLRDTIVKLPDGSEIYTQRETIFRHDGKEIRSEESKGCIAIWKRPGQPEKKLVTLTPNSDSKNNYVCSSNSNKAKVNISDDGNRVWLVRDGQVIYSFDYQKGVAILGLHGQPEWAVVKEPFGKNKYFSEKPEIEYKKVLKKFDSLREFLMYPVTKITITDVNEDYLNGNDKKNISKDFTSIQITDAATINKFVEGMYGIQYDIVALNTAGALTLPMFRIKFQTAEKEKSIWVFSFGYSLIDTAELIYMFNSKLLTDVLRETLEKHNRKIEMNWKRMATGYGKYYESCLPSEYEESVVSKIIGYSGKFGCNYPLYQVAMKKMPNNEVEITAIGTNRSTSKPKVAGPGLLPITWYAKLSVRKQQKQFIFLVTYEQSSKNPNYYVFRISSPILMVQNNVVIGASGKAEIEKFQWLEDQQKFKFVEKLGSEKIEVILISNTDYKKLKLPEKVIKLMAN